jgi:hypothetical protein
MGSPKISEGGGTKLEDRRRSFPSGRKQEKFFGNSWNFGPAFAIA